MSETEKDELIDAQKQVIGILFEVIKRLQTNNDLDEEYFQIITIIRTSNLVLYKWLNHKNSFFISFEMMARGMYRTRQGHNLRVIKEKSRL